MNIFVINLRDSETRREEMRSQIDHVIKLNGLTAKDMNDCSNVVFDRCTAYKGVKFHGDAFNFFFFDAVNVSELDIKKERLCGLKYIKYTHREMTKGEKACFLSHRKVWEIIKASDNGVVLEDDLFLKENFFKDLRTIGNTKFLYVRLMHLQEKAFKRLDLGGFFATFDFLGGAQGYYLNSTGAKMLLDSSKDAFKSVDGYIDEPFFHGVFTVGYRDSLIEVNPHYHLTTNSDVRSNSNEIKYGTLKKIVHRIYKRIYNIRRKRFYKRHDLKHILDAGLGVQSLHNN